MTYGNEIRPLLVDVGLKFERAEMQMIRWMCGISLKDRRTNEELRRLVGVEPITTFIRGGRLRWYGHLMKKCDEDWAHFIARREFSSARGILCMFRLPIHGLIRGVFMES